MITNFMERIKGRCRIDDCTGCWIWCGALVEGYPRVYAPNFTRNVDGKPGVQNGTRAMWHVSSGKPIPKGYRVYHAKCTNALCINPDHLQCGPSAHVGIRIKTAGIFRDQPARIQANRQLGRARSKVTPELARYIASSSKSGEALANELNLGRTIISRVRRGTLVSVLAIGNPFSGLIQPTHQSQ